jgi:putative NADH-flavin reductase
MGEVSRSKEVGGKRSRLALTRQESKAMKLLVLGATGGVGQEIISQAIERNHTVTAFVRSAKPLDRFAGRIAVVQGNVLNRGELAKVIKGHDAVLSALGPRQPIAKSDHDLLERFATALTAAMNDAGVQRLVVVSTAFLFKNSILPPAYLVGRLFFPSVVADATEMECIVEKSGLDFTIVRPPQLNNKPRTQKYRTREDHLPAFGFSISRADVAHFMLEDAQRRSHTARVVGVCA